MRSKNLTVSIPAELHERLGKWRRLINISGVCRRALEEEIERRERQPELEKADMDKLVERVAQRLLGIRERFFDAGYKRGLAWIAEEADYEEIPRVLKPESVFVSPWPDSVTTIRAGEIKELRQKYGTSDRGAWNDGFRSAVQAVWTRLEDELEARQLAEELTTEADELPFE